MMILPKPRTFSVSTTKIFSDFDYFEAPITFVIRGRVDHTIWQKWQEYSELATDDDRLEVLKIMLKAFIISIESDGKVYPVLTDEIDTFCANIMEVDPARAIFVIYQIAIGVMSTLLAEREAILGKPKTVPAVSNTTAKEKPKAARKRQG
jgi:hypothetical protein